MFSVALTREHNITDMSKNARLTTRRCLADLASAAIGNRNENGAGKPHLEVTLIVTRNEKNKNKDAREAL